MARGEVACQPTTERMTENVKAAKTKRMSHGRKILDQHFRGELIEWTGTAFSTAHVDANRLVSGSCQAMHQFGKVGYPASQANRLNLMRSGE